MTQRLLRLTLRAAPSQHGSRAALLSAFPTVTFPNHWGIATGLFPETHGIIENSFLLFDKSKPGSPGERFSMQNTDPKFWLGERAYPAAAAPRLPPLKPPPAQPSG